MVSSPMLLSLAAALVLLLATPAHAKTRAEWMTFIDKTEEVCNKELKVTEAEVLAATKNYTSYVGLAKNIKCVLSCYDIKLFGPGTYDDKRFAEYTTFFKEISADKPDVVAKLLKAHAACKSTFKGQDPCEGAVDVNACYTIEQTKLGVQNYLDD